MPSASHWLPPCPGRRQHDWRLSIGRTVRARGGSRVETCTVCGTRRIVTGSGRVLLDSRGDV